MILYLLNHAGPFLVTHSFSHYLVFLLFNLEVRVFYYEFEVLIRSLIAQFELFGASLRKSKSIQGEYDRPERETGGGF